MVRSGNLKRYMTHFNGKRIFETHERFYLGNCVIPKKHNGQTIKVVDQIDTQTKITNESENFLLKENLRLKYTSCHF